MCVMKRCSRNLLLKSMKGRVCASLMTVVLLLVAGVALAQNGNLGIQEADRQVRGYFVDGTKLMYAIGAVVGLIGAVRVYIKWSGGDQDTSRVAASWFGACVFLVLVATVIKMFFGI